MKVFYVHLRGLSRRSLRSQGPLRGALLPQYVPCPLLSASFHGVPSYAAYLPTLNVARLSKGLVGEDRSERETNRRMEKQKLTLFVPPPFHLLHTDGGRERGVRMKGKERDRYILYRERSERVRYREL